MFACDEQASRKAVPLPPRPKNVGCNIKHSLLELIANGLRENGHGPNQKGYPVYPGIKGILGIALH